MIILHNIIIILVSMSVLYCTALRVCTKYHTVHTFNTSRIASFHLTVLPDVTSRNKRNLIQFSSSMCLNDIKYHRQNEAPPQHRCCMMPGLQGEYVMEIWCYMRKDALKPFLLFFCTHIPRRTTIAPFSASYQRTLN